MTEWGEMWVRWEVWKKPEDELYLERASSEGMAGSARTSPASQCRSESAESSMTTLPGQQREAAWLLSRACSLGIWWAWRCRPFPDVSSLPNNVWNSGLDERHLKLPVMNGPSPREGGCQEACMLGQLR